MAGEPLAQVISPVDWGGHSLEFWSGSSSWQGSALLHSPWPVDTPGNCSQKVSMTKRPMGGCEMWQGLQDLIWFYPSLSCHPRPGVRGASTARPVATGRTRGPGPELVDGKLPVRERGFSTHWLHFAPAPASWLQEPALISASPPGSLAPFLWLSVCWITFQLSTNNPPNNSKPSCCFSNSGSWKPLRADSSFTPPAQSHPWFRLCPTWELLAITFLGQGSNWAFWQLYIGNCHTQE